MQEEFFSPSLNHLMAKVQTYTLPNIHHLLLLYDYCIDFILLNELTQDDYEELVNLFVQHVMTLLLQGGYGETIKKYYERLTYALEKKGAMAESALVILNGHRINLAHIIVH